MLCGTSDSDTSFKDLLRQANIILNAFIHTYMPISNKYVTSNNIKDNKQNRQEYFSLYDMIVISADSESESDSEYVSSERESDSEYVSSERESDSEYVSSERESDSDSSSSVSKSYYNSPESESSEISFENEVHELIEKLNNITIEKKAEIPFSLLLHKHIYFPFIYPEDIDDKPDTKLSINWQAELDILIKTIKNKLKNLTYQELVELDIIAIVIFLRKISIIRTFQDWEFSTKSHLEMIEKWLKCFEWIVVKRDQLLQKKKAETTNNTNDLDIIDIEEDEELNITNDLNKKDAVDPNKKIIDEIDNLLAPILAKLYYQLAIHYAIRSKATNLQEMIAANYLGSAALLYKRKTFPKSEKLELKIYHRYVLAQLAKGRKENFKYSNLLKDIIELAAKFNQYNPYLVKALFDGGFYFYHIGNKDSLEFFNAALKYIELIEATFKPLERDHKEKINKFIKIISTSVNNYALNIACKGLLPTKELVADDFGFKISYNPPVTPVYASKADYLRQKPRLFVCKAKTKKPTELDNIVLNNTRDGMFCSTTVTDKTVRLKGLQWEDSKLIFKFKNNKGNNIKCTALPKDKITIKNGFKEEETFYLYELRPGKK